MTMFFPCRDSPHKPLYLHQNSFSHWCDQNTLIFGIFVEKKVLFTYTICPCTTYEVGAIIPISQMRKEPREGK